MNNYQDAFLFHKKGRENRDHYHKNNLPKIEGDIVTFIGSTFQYYGETECYKQNKPIIGVCHGAFFINQLEEGTNVECEGHHNTEHDIIMYDKTYKVNSFHTNKITKVGKDFDVIATTVDGDVEAFKHKTKPIWGIVWHPERMQEAILPNDLERLLNAN